MAPASRWLLVGVVAAVLVGGGVVAANLGILDQGDSESTTVTAVDSETGDELATVDVRIADSLRERYIGLSNTTALGADEGMLFVHEAEGRKGYVMRNMAFPIDIVFINADREITTIHHAEVDDDQTFYGTAKYVLEVPYEYTTDNGIEVGDRVEIPTPYR